MADIEATVIETVIGSIVSEDGQHMLLKVRVPSGNEPVLAIPIEEATSLIDLAADALTQSDKVAGRGYENRRAFTAAWFEVGRDRSSGQATLSLTFGAGGVLTFLLPGSMPQQIHETLAAMDGEMPPKSGNVRH
jgi:hypothetical protein